jgi:S-phase kinase-associated protein 1
MSDSEQVFGLDEEEVGGLKLTSKDGVSFDVERKYAFVSRLLKTSCESDATATEIPVPSVLGDTLALVVEYMNHHKGVPGQLPEKPLKSKNMNEIVTDQWDADFIDRIGVEKKSLYDLILAANYLDIQPLLHLGCAKVASLIKGQPLERIREILDPRAAASVEKSPVQ